MAHLFDIPVPTDAEGKPMKGQVEPVNALSVRAGQDKFKNIEEPEGAGQRQASMEHLWQEVIERTFPRQ